MKNHLTTFFNSRTAHKIFRLLMAAALALACVSNAAAQKEKKKKNEPPPPADNSSTVVPMPDEQQIEFMLSEMLAAWQLGDVEKLHKYYADDVSLVNGSWAPPVIGWTNYLAVYQQQRTRMQQVGLERSNTYIRVNGTVGWACYQWDFVAILDGQPASSQGQTTVVLQKRNNRWVIVHNHTSLAPKQQSAPANTPPAQPPAKPAGR
jgi:ketosteroid isomerase-like protein